VTAFTTVQVTVRYFAVARAAARTEVETLCLLTEATIADMVETLARRNPKLGTVLTRCSHLCNSVAVRDRSVPLRAGDVVDVLPPFAGG
jgi:molybdopterin synthase sulfur carrier subunit